MALRRKTPRNDDDESSPKRVRKSASRKSSSRKSSSRKSSSRKSSSRRRKTPSRRKSTSNYDVLQYWVNEAKSKGYNSRHEIMDYIRKEYSYIGEGDREIIKKIIKDGKNTGSFTSSSGTPIFTDGSSGEYKEVKSDPFLVSSSSGSSNSFSRNTFNNDRFSGVTSSSSVSDEYKPVKVNKVSSDDSTVPVPAVAANDFSEPVQASWINNGQPIQQEQNNSGSFFSRIGNLFGNNSTQQSQPTTTVAPTTTSPQVTTTLPEQVQSPKVTPSETSTFKREPTSKGVFTRQNVPFSEQDTKTAQNTDTVPQNSAQTEKTIQNISSMLDQQDALESTFQDPRQIPDDDIEVIQANNSVQNKVNANPAPFLESNTNESMVVAKPDVNDLSNFITKYLPQLQVAIAACSDPNLIMICSLTVLEDKLNSQNLSDKDLRLVLQLLNAFGITTRNMRKINTIKNAWVTWYQNRCTGNESRFNTFSFKTADNQFVCLDIEQVLRKYVIVNNKFDENTFNNLPQDIDVTALKIEETNTREKRNAGNRQNKKSTIVYLNKNDLANLIWQAAARVQYYLELLK